MTTFKVIAALLVLTITNVLVFANIAWNRSGEATGVMVFDQCELNFRRGGLRSKKPSQALSLDYVSGKVDRDAIEGLYRIDPNVDKAVKRFKRRLYVVLKHDGLEWQEYITSKKENAGRGYFRYLNSKLIIVDGNTDAERLREKYPETEGRAIMAGYVVPVNSTAKSPHSYDWYTSIRDVAIQSRYRDVLYSIHRARKELEREARRKSGKYVKPPCTPTHRITIRWGRRFEPWISSVDAI
ncbi:MAG: DUF4824 family protein [Alphaproteobacteria bacterium]|jgi:hypothetical protein|nr:DUF4824 family protein [Alphaproteobacteria bacterium]